MTISASDRHSVADRMTVAVCVDGGFVKHALVMVASLLNSGQSLAFDVHVFHAAANAVDLAEFDLLFEGETRHRCELRAISLDQFESFPASASISVGTYARLLVPHLLPDRAKTLYLDADLIVQDDLASFWRTNLAGYAAAVVEDPLCDNRDAIGFMPVEPYFNAGVMLMNLDLWRAEPLAEAVVDCVKTQGLALKYFDQDALNIVLKGRVLFCSPRWNFQPRMADVEAIDLRCQSFEFARARARPAVIHYTTPYKPWRDPYAVHYGDAYLACLSMIRPAARDRYFPGLPKAGVRVSHLKRRLRWRFPKTYRAARRAARAVRASVAGVVQSTATLGRADGRPKARSS